MWLGCFGAFKKNNDAACDVFLTLYSFQIFSILTARLKYIAFEFSIKSMWNQFYWGPGPNFNVCVQSSHYQQAILRHQQGVRESNSTQLNVDTMYRRWRWIPQVKGAVTQDHPTLQFPITSPHCYLSFGVTGYILEVPKIPSITECQTKIRFWQT